MIRTRSLIKETDRRAQRVTGPFMSGNPSLFPDIRVGEYAVKKCNEGKE